ncbi:UDP-3-O-(3-hydroxymyristoyl)glucosamine N-acyltransferase [Bdellovibrio sp. HCB209]|uniref:UDP-3-O-(3-hydroxymyristoyl)glucosamine N-acyltransferase n=1 Tax=Bdellovibrio sp. HCB209 TaxID=3394354 RepID=UPI0039B4E611
MITSDVIISLQSPDVSYVSGSKETIAKRVLPPDQADSESLVFVTKPDQLEKALKAHSPIIVAHKALTLPTDSQVTFFMAPNIQLAMATILPLFDGKMNRFNQETKVHPTAFIHETAHLGQNVSVGPFAVIGEHVRIGDGATIGAHVVIESYAQIGTLTILHPQVFIGAYSEIGAHCEFHPHTTIGADGFSFAMAKDGTHRKIPQIGKVVIEDNVELGANCAVDRAALTETRIGSGTKMDNFCHVAHNCIIGKNNVMAAGFKIAGSSVIGDNCMIGGDTAVSDHVHICDRVILAGRSAVTNDVQQSGAYGGYPLEPMRDSLKTLANLSQLTRIRKELARVVKHLGLKEE